MQTDRSTPLVEHMRSFEKGRQEQQKIIKDGHRNKHHPAPGTVSLPCDLAAQVPVNQTDILWSDGLTANRGEWNWEYLSIWGSTSSYCVKSCNPLAWSASGSWKFTITIQARSNMSTSMQVPQGFRRASLTFDWYDHSRTVPPSLWVPRWQSSVLRCTQNCCNPYY